MIYIHTNKPSDGASTLGKHDGFKKIKLKGSKFVPQAGKIVINWGDAGELGRLGVCRVLNKPEAIRKTANKLSFFRYMGNEEATKDLIPWFTEDKKEAAARMKAKACKMVCRKVLNGSGGDGIVIAAKADDLVDAPLYTQYVPKDEEYRIHVMRGKAFDFQRKARVKENANPNWQIRNLEGGFIYAREGFITPKCVIEAAEKIMNATTLDFGAVDVLFTKKGNAVVLEINSAPGLMGTTADNYAEAFKGYANGKA